MRKTLRESKNLKSQTITVIFSRLALQLEEAKWIRRLISSVLQKLRACNKSMHNQKYQKQVVTLES